VRVASVGKIIGIMGQVRVVSCRVRTQVRSYKGNPGARGGDDFIRRINKSPAAGRGLASSAVAELKSKLVDVTPYRV
jgi:hypothetical protein